MKYIFFFICLTALCKAQSEVFLSLEDFNQIHYVETSKFHDGSAMSDGKTDNFIYKKKGTKYYVLADFLMGNAISAKTFGVTADGITDDTQAMQTALSAASDFGFTLILPSGTIITSDDLVLDLSKSKHKSSVRGSGVGNTVIRNIGNKTKNALLVTGNYFNNLDIRDFRIERDLSTAMPTGQNGLVIEKQVYGSIENIEVIRFVNGVVLRDVSSAYLKGVNARYCGTGFYFERGDNGSSNPNLIALYSCVLTSNSDWGITIVNGHSVTIQTSLFEDNKKGGIIFSFDRTNGGTSLNLLGSYFEGNKGTDVYLKATAAGAHNFIGNTFNRVDAAQYTQHNIVLDLMTQESNSDRRHYVNLTGNSFFVANNYKSDMARKAVVIKSDNFKNVTVHDVNYYQKPEDNPKYHKDIHLIN